jgi:hypothetical protein
MQTATVLHKQKRLQKFNLNQTIAMVKHDLLLDDPLKRKQHRLSTMSSMNIYKFNGVSIQDEAERNVALGYIESLLINDNKKIDLNSLSKQKCKIKKWLTSPTSKFVEQELFKEMMDTLEGELSLKMNTESIVSRFEGINRNMGKISRFNDKLRAIRAVCNLHNERRLLKVDQSSQRSCAIVSVIFKIPHHNECSLDDELQAKLITSYYKNKFPNFPIILEIIHRDEIDPHVHLTISGKNVKTGKYDFVQRQYQHVKEKYDLKYPDRNSKLSHRQVRHVGELLQTDFYEFINEQQTQILFKKKEYSSPAQKKNERDIIKHDTNKRIADREFNTATFLADENKMSQALNEEFKRELILLREQYGQDLRAQEVEVRKRNDKFTKEAALREVNARQHASKLDEERLQRDEAAKSHADRLSLKDQELRAKVANWEKGAKQRVNLFKSDISQLQKEFEASKNKVQKIGSELEYKTAALQMKSDELTNITTELYDAVKHTLFAAFSMALGDLNEFGKSHRELLKKICDRSPDLTNFLAKIVQDMQDDPLKKDSLNAEFQRIQSKPTLKVESQNESAVMDIASRRMAR